MAVWSVVTNPIILDEREMIIRFLNDVNPLWESVLQWRLSSVYAGNHVFQHPLVNTSTVNFD